MPPAKKCYEDEALYLMLRKLLLMSQRWSFLGK